MFISSIIIAQVLMAIYFFLAGWLLSQSRRLWIMPAASAVFAVIWALTDAACTALLKTYRCAAAMSCQSCCKRAPQKNDLH